MIEIAVLIGPEGVRKTQIFVNPGDHSKGFDLYEKVLPGIRQIDTALKVENPKEGQNEEVARG